MKRNSISVDLMGRNGGQGELANYMQEQGRMDPGSMRPFVGADGAAMISIYNGGDPDVPESPRDSSIPDPRPRAERRSHSARTRRGGPSGAISA